MARQITKQVPERNSAIQRRDVRKGGEVAQIACTCAIKLNEIDPIVELAGGGIDNPIFRPNYTTQPACTPNPNCQITTTYAWTLSDAVPAQGGPVIDGAADKETVKVKNRGTFKLKLDVRVKCSGPGDEANRITRCSSSGEAEFEIT